MVSEAQKTGLLRTNKREPKAIMEEVLTSPHYSDGFKNLFKATEIDWEMTRPSEPPDWLDKTRFLAGQKYFKSNMASILISNYVNLTVGLAVPNLCEPLILTGRSHTVSLTWHRYMHTVKYVLRWYEQIPWQDSGSWAKVNKLHLQAARAVRRMSRARRKKKVEEKLPKAATSMTERDLMMLNHLQQVKKSHMNKICSKAYEAYISSERVFTQFDMSIVHLSFFGTVISHPSRYGASQGSERELEDFLHFWRVTGYYLGLDDQYNCAIGAEHVRNITREIMDNIVIPCLLNLDPNAVHMAKTLSEAFGTDFHVILHTFLKENGVEFDENCKLLSRKDHLLMFIRSAIFDSLMNIRFIRVLFNSATAFWIQSSSA